MHARHTPSLSSHLRLALPWPSGCAAKMPEMTLTVLVVDDDDGFRKLVSRMLRSWGLTVLGEAGTSAEGLLRTTELRPDVVLVDVGLPDGDGFSLTNKIVGLPWQPRVVVISSDADRANAAAALDAGAVGFVAKEELPGTPARTLISGA
jgi:CheY-like chemotaxis protein